MIKRALLMSGVAIAAMAQPAAAKPWTRGYVVGFYEYAFRYGGRMTYERGKEIQPGVDCPHGSTVHFANPDAVAKSFSLVPWRTPKEVQAIANPPETGDLRDQAGIYYPVWRQNSAFRGYRKDIETYVNPFAADDPGEPEVQSKIGEGFDLDHKVKASDFVSPDGEQGIDNNLYKAWGCDQPWRGDGNATLTLRSNDKMNEGLFTIVFRLSGNKDPMNDDDVTLEVGRSPDHVMKDARGNTGVDYSFRMIKGAQYSKIKAKIKDGVLETEQTEIHMPQIAWFPNQNRDADFHDGKIRIVMKSDGTAAGLVGGYRNWRDLYTQNTFAQDGGQQGVREHEDMVSLYYALRRNADGMFNPKTGRYDGISSAYRMKLAEAFVIDPKDAMAMPGAAPGDRDRLTGFDHVAAAFTKATNTLAIQLVPNDSSEAAVVPGSGYRNGRFGGAARGPAANGKVADAEDK